MFKLIVPILILLTGGCAYYNTFYNANSSYEEALLYAREHPDDPSSYEEALLDKAISGAGKVLAGYPDSRWVDDAQLLLGKALLLRGQRSLTGSGRSYLQEAMMSFVSVTVMTDDEEMLDQARLGQGIAAMELGRYNDATAVLVEISSDNQRTQALSRLLLCEAYLKSDHPEMAAAIFDTLLPAGDDSLRAEYYITGGIILTALGQPDSGAVMCLRATEIEQRGDVFYRALVTAAESYVEAGKPEKASQELQRLLLGYRSDREMADISLLKGRADELAGFIEEALTAYLDASELDSYRETGAEALYRRSVLLEQQERYDEAFLSLGECSSRPGDFMWLRLAENRKRNLELYITYSDSVNTTDGRDKVHYNLLAAEKRLDLYGLDTLALEALYQVIDSDYIPFSQMALLYMVDYGVISSDSVEIVLLSILNQVPQSNLAGMIEERLGFPPGPEARNRPSAVLERAWRQIELMNWQSAVVSLDNLLESPFGYELKAEILWAAYVASEAARMEDAIVSGYLKQLTDEFPDTPEGIEASLRRAVGLEEENPEDDGEE